MTEEQVGPIMAKGNGGRLMTHRIAATILVASSALPAGPALADEFYAVTPSGRAEAYFDTSVVRTSDVLANKCLDAGWTVVSSTETVVTCEAEMNFGQRLLSALLVGNQYSTTPRLYYRFNLAGSGQSTRVQVNAWLETQMAFGQIRREDFSGAPFHNSAMDFFVLAGGRFPLGTEFPNHAYVGSSFEIVDGPQEGLQVNELVAGGPADLAGLQSGDIITRIARKRVKDTGDLLDALAKAGEAASYEIEYYRGGKKSSASISRAFREPVLPPVFEASEEPEPVLLTESPPPSGLSVADELAKFARLRDDGIITAEEFEAQKSKLLGQ